LTGRRAYRPYCSPCAGVELAPIDAHRAAEAAADLERRLDDGVAREARRDRFEQVTLRGGLRAVEAPQLAGGEGWHYAGGKQAQRAHALLA
jgi:hypothetical protein